MQEGWDEGTSCLKYKYFLKMDKNGEKRKTGPLVQTERLAESDILRPYFSLRKRPQSPKVYSPVTCSCLYTI